MIVQIRHFYDTEDGAAWILANTFLATLKADDVMDVKVLKGELEREEIFVMYQTEEPFDIFALPARSSTLCDGEVIIRTEFNPDGSVSSRTTEPVDKEKLAKKMEEIKKYL